MSEVSKPNPPHIPDLTLERHLAGDLPARKSAQIESLAKQNPLLQERIKTLQNERSAFYEKHPPQQIAATILNRATAPSRPPIFTWKNWTLALPAVAAMAYGLLISVQVPENLEHLEHTARVPTPKLAEKAAQDIKTKDVFDDFSKTTQESSSVAHKHARFKKKATTHQSSRGILGSTNSAPSSGGRAGEVFEDLVKQTQKVGMAKKLSRKPAPARKRKMRRQAPSLKSTGQSRQASRLDAMESSAPMRPPVYEPESSAAPLAYSKMADSAAPRLATGKRRAKLSRSSASETHSKRTRTRTTGPWPKDIMRPQRIATLLQKQMTQCINLSESNIVSTEPVEVIITLTPDKKHNVQLKPTSYKNQAWGKCLTMRVRSWNLLKIKQGTAQLRVFLPIPQK
jgi:hypothetical protein